MPTGEIDFYEYLDSVIASSAKMPPLETLLSGLTSAHAQNLGMNSSQQKTKTRGRISPTLMSIIAIMWVDVNSAPNPRINSEYSTH